MKKLIVFTLVSLGVGHLALAQEALDMSKLPNGNTLNAQTNQFQSKPDSFQKIEESLASDEKIECDKDGCTFHTTLCKGREIRVGAVAGVGTTASTGNVTIYDGQMSDPSAVNYSLSMTYINTNYSNTVKIDKSEYEFIKKNLMAASTKEHLKASMDQRDPATSKELELALSLAVSLNGTSCSNTQSTYAH